MPNYLGYPFDPELFNYMWEQEKDMTLTRIIDSGAVQNNAQLRNLISNGSDFYTLPFYKLIGGEPQNYDGATDIQADEPKGGSQSGIVYGRTHGWTEKQFVRDYNSGANPMEQIARQVSKYWNKQRQATLLGILDAIFGIKGTGATAAWEDHKTDLASASTTVTDDNKFGVTTAGDAIQKACGDAYDQFSLIFMHSKVATDLHNQQLLEYLKYTDANGIERPLPIGTLNGMTVIIDDGCPHTAASSSAAAKYTTYIIGTGAIQYAPAPVSVPSEVSRDPSKNGGQNTLWTRVRETIHPNGFSFTKPSGYTASPTQAQLTDKANWSIAAEDIKSIALAKVVTNG